jgi:DNA-binding MarR family transcriptional regulator
MAHNQAEHAALDEKTSDILRSLRRIIRRTDISSREQEQLYGVTAPQLLCLIAVVEAGTTTQVELSERLHLGGSTINGVVDRLEHKGLIARSRDPHDRRRLLTYATDAGKELVRTAPPPLHQRLVNGLKNMNEEERNTIAESLHVLVELLEAQHLDVAPILVEGTINLSDDRRKT